MKTRPILSAISLAMLAACSAPSATDATTQPAATPPRADAMDNHPGQVAYDRLDARVDMPIGVKSDALATQQPIDARFTNYGQNQSPPLSWSAAARAQSYAVMLEDPDAKMPQPFVHWVAWNIPAATTSLPAALPTDGSLTRPEARQGRNGKDGTGYFGPRPPAGDPPHHYHFEVFALDRMLDLPDGADRDALVQAMQGHVLAKGELVATSEAPAGAE